MNKLILGIVSGFAIGGAISLLTSPHSGKENRRRFKNYYQDVSAHAKDTASQSKDLMDSVDNVKFEVDQLKDVYAKEIQSVVKSFQFEAEPRIRRIQDHAERLQGDVQTAQENIQ